MTTNKEKLTRKINEIIQKQIRPGLEMDGGSIELIDFDDKSGILKVRLLGHCVGCPMSTMTMLFGVERIIRQNVPEVKKVVSV